MATTPQQIDLWRSVTSEHQRLEFKEAKNQHCTLKWVMSERMTNQTLRERFHLPEAKVASISKVISTTIEAKLIKLDEKAGGSRKFARYLPFWA